MRDLLKTNSIKGKSPNTLRVREHPKEGPYVQVSDKLCDGGGVGGCGGGYVKVLE